MVIPPCCASPSQNPSYGTGHPTGPRQLITGLQPGIDAATKWADFTKASLLQMACRDGGGCFVGAGAIDDDLAIPVEAAEARMHVRRVSGQRAWDHAVAGPRFRSTDVQNDRHWVRVHQGG